MPNAKLMLNLASDREKINVLLERLHEIHTIEEARHKIAALNLSSAFAVAYELLEKNGGRVLTFYSRIENCGPGINVAIENAKNYNTEHEKEMFKPNVEFYTDLSSKMFLKRITVDIFCCSSHAVQISNPSLICQRTGGDVYYFKNFSERLDSDKFFYDVFRILTRNGAYDVAFRVRCSEGYAVTAYVGNFVRFNAIDFELPSIDADKTIGVIMRSEGALMNLDKFSVQAAMLYTTPDGDRKIRIFNLFIPVATKFSQIFRYIDQEALHQLIVKDSLSYIGIKKVVAIKDDLIQTVVKMLRAYRSEGVSFTNPTEIIVPESLRYL